MIRIILAAALVTGAAAQAQSLKEFLDASEKNSIDLKISVEVHKRAAAEHRQVWTSLFPSLTATAGWTHNQYNAEIVTNPMTMTKVIIVPYDQFDAAFRFDLPLIDVQRWMRMGVFGALEESARFKEQVTRDAIRKAVISNYYGFAAALALRESAKKSAGVAEAQLKLTEIRAGAGTVTELDLARSKAEVARTRQVLADTETLVASTRRSMRTLSGLEPSDTIPQPVDDLRPVEPLADLEARIDLLPAVQAADTDASASGTQATAAKLLLVPTVNAQFTERLTNATGFQGQAATFNTGINLTWRLDVPMFMGMQVQDANAAMATLAKERARLISRDTINGDWLRLNAALIKIEAAKAQLAANQRAAQVAKDRYAVGAATQLDVIQAERDLFAAEVNQITARTELATARASLHISAAQPLD